MNYNMLEHTQIKSTATICTCVWNAYKVQLKQHIEEGKKQSIFFTLEKETNVTAAMKGKEGRKREGSGTQLEAW